MSEKKQVKKADVKAPKKDKSESSKAKPTVAKKTPKDKPSKAKPTEVKESTKKESSKPTQTKESPQDKKVQEASKKKQDTVKTSSEKKPETKSVDEPQKAEEKEKPKPEKKVRKPKKIEKIKHNKPRQLSEEEASLVKKKPKFSRQELHTRKRLEDKWRRARGIDSKQHEGKRGKGKTPSIGYKNPAKVSGLSSGFVPVMVYNATGLDNIDPSRDAAVISSSIGRRKRNDIIIKANERGITILNPRKGEI